MTNASASRFTCQHAAHFLDFHGVNQRGREGPFANQPHQLRAVVHSGPGQGQNRPDQAVRPAAVVPQVQHNPLIGTGVQVLGNPGGKVLHRQLFVLNADVVLNVVRVFIQRHGKVTGILRGGFGEIFDLVRKTGKLDVPKFLHGSGFQRKRLAVFQTDFQRRVLFHQPHIFIDIRDIAGLPNLPPEMHRVIGRKQRSKGFHSFRQRLPGKADDLLSQKRLVLRGGQGEHPGIPLLGSAVGIGPQIRVAAKGDHRVRIPHESRQPHQVHQEFRFAFGFQTAFDLGLQGGEFLLRAVGEHVGMMLFQNFLVKKLQILFSALRAGILRVSRYDQQYRQQQCRSPPQYILHGLSSYFTNSVIQSYNRKIQKSSPLCRNFQKIQSVGRKRGKEGVFSGCTRILRYRRQKFFKIPGFSCARGVGQERRPAESRGRGRGRLSGYR